MDIIKKVEVSLLGEQLIEENQSISQPSFFCLILPNEFEYNQSWRVSFLCSSCNNKIEIAEDFDAGEKKYKWIKKITSVKFSFALLKGLSQLFTGLYLHEIKGVTYINRTDFKYSFEFQRTDSINLLWSKCTHCGRLYIGDVKIGYPLLPEPNIPSGKLGKVRIEKLIGINESWEGYQELVSHIEAVK